VDGKRTELVAIDRSFKNFVDRRKPAVVAYLIDESGADSPIAQSCRGLQVQREWLFAKNVLAGIQNLRGNFFMSRIRSTDEDGVTPIQKFLERSSGLTAEPGGHRLREGRVYVKKTPQCHAGIL
jgi:hypothetical protein